MTKRHAAVEFGQEIRRRRLALNMTLDDVAHRCGLTANFISSIENGKRNPSLSTILALAVGLRIQASELFPSISGLGLMAVEAARLFDKVPLEVQIAVVTIMRSVAKKRRR